MPEKIVLLDIGTILGNPKAIAAYSSKHINISNIDTLYFSNFFKTDKEVKNYVRKVPGMFVNQTSLAPYLHELGHAYHYNIVQRIMDKDNLSYNNAKNKFDDVIVKYIKDNNINVRKMISEYASNGIEYKGTINELIAEWFSIRHTNKTNKLIDFITDYIKEFD